MKIALGCDHGALMLKNALIPFLQSMGHSVADFGTYSPESCDYPDFAAAAARAVADGDCDRGIVLCTTGIGVSITANKIKGIRCALLSDLNSARLTRLHNDTNMMALGAAIVSQDLAFAIVETWLNTPFSNEDRHQRRIDKVMSCERGLKKKRSRKHRRRRSAIGRLLSSLVAKPLTILISILLVLSLVLTPIATYITSMTNPSRLVDILFSSGIFDNAQEPTGDPDAPSEGDDTNVPSEGDDTNTPAEGDDTNMPAEGDDTNTPAEGDDTNMPAEGDDTNTPAESDDPNAPATIAEEDANTPAEGEGEGEGEGDGDDTNTPADGEDSDAPADEGSDVPSDSENDTPSDSEDTDAPSDSETLEDSSSISATQSLLAALQGMISSDMMDEDTLHTALGIPAETPIDTELLAIKLAGSDAAQALVSAYLTDAMESAMGIDQTPSLSSDTVMGVVTPHIGQLTEIVLECLPEGTEVDPAALEAATLQALEVALPVLVDALPDVSEATTTLREQVPVAGFALDMLKFIYNGSLRAAVLLLVLLLIIVLCLFRLPGLRGLRCVGICGMVGGTLCGALYLLLGMPTLHSLLAQLPLVGPIISEFSLSFAHEFAVCGVIYGVIGLFLVLSTTVLRTFFAMIFDAIFSRN